MYFQHYRFKIAGLFSVFERFILRISHIIIIIIRCSRMFRNVPCSWFYRRPALSYLCNLVPRAFPLKVGGAECIFKRYYCITQGIYPILVGSGLSTFLCLTIDQSFPNCIPVSQQRSNNIKPRPGGS